jgi:hypothetical protein
MSRGPTLGYGAIGAILCIASACGAESPACVDGDENGACLSSVRLTYLNVRYDLSEPVFVNNRVPVELGITATSPDPEAPSTRNVAVTLSFIEADPVDPAEPIECASNALDLTLVGDGEEHLFNAFVWPTTLCEGLVGKTVNLRVEFDGGEDAETGIDYPPVAFTAAARDAALIQACRSVADPSAPDLGRGCVYSFDIQPTPSDETGTLIDVRYATLAPASSVAILPHVDAAATAADLEPSLVVQSTLVVNGRDPYITGLAPEDVPPELETIAPGITEDLQFGVDPAELDTLTAMPGRATLRYELTPAADPEAGFLPLTIGDPSSEVGGDHVTEVVIDELLAGTANTFAHELFAEGDTRAALDDGGAWSDVSDFTVRGCFTAEFAQQGNAGEPDTSDCRTFPIVLVRETAIPSSATSIAFNEELTRELGNPNRLGISARLVTQNRLDRDGAFSRVEGEVELEGKLGRSFSVTVARAVGQVSLGADSEETGYEITVDAFNQRIYSVSESDPNLVHEEEFSAAKSFSFPGLGFGFGPVRVGFRFSLGGEVSFATEDRLAISNDAAECATLLRTTNALETCGSIARSVTPGFNFTASIEGGIDLRIVKAGVVADLDLVNTDFPLEASLAFGVGDHGRLTVLGNANWQLGMQLIRGSVAIVGRVGVRRFSRSLRVNLFSFSSPRFTRTLLDRSMDVSEVLE